MSPGLKDWATFAIGGFVWEETSPIFADRGVAKNATTQSCASRVGGTNYRKPRSAVHIAGNADLSLVIKA